jgi:hypothetical protein
VPPTLKNKEIFWQAPPLPASDDPAWSGLGLKQLRPQLASSAWSVAKRRARAEAWLGAPHGKANNEDDDVSDSDDSGSIGADARNDEVVRAF